VCGQNGVSAILEGPTVVAETEWLMSFYLGPKEIEAMASVDVRLEQTLDYAGIFSFISKGMLKFLIFLFRYIHNYGLAIILLTLIVKLLLLPFSLKGEKGMKEGKEMQKKMSYVQQKYKDDPERLAQEKAELIRKHGMPGLTGCLPLLLQFPIFIALNRVLSGSIELYKAPLGLWISDLSIPDPYYVLPFIIFLTMLLQTATAQPSQRLMMVAMGLLFGVISASFSAGLALYLCVNTIFTIAQTILYKKYQAS
jgi:YidC/Oxa1 family membrane protein insertase